VRSRPAGRTPDTDAAATRLDVAFFAFGGVSAIWLAYLLLRESFSLGWGELWFSFLWWALLAYLVLPRLQRILTRIYVPNYFIGRTRTSDGLLGDPVNIALLGSEAQIHTAMTAAGWRRADDLTVRTGWRIVCDTLARRSYPEAPVSPLFLFERRQDFAYQQQVGTSPGSRHHVRFWQCPAGWKLPGGRAVDWVASASFDRSVGLSLFTLQVTHKVAADTDTERDYIVHTVAAANPVARVSVIEDFSAGYHARNGGGDSIETDGNLPIIDLRRVGIRDDAAAVMRPTPRKTPPAPIVVGTALLGARAAVAFTTVITLVLLWTTAHGVQPTGTHVVGAGSTHAAGAGTWTLIAVVSGIALFALAEVVIAGQIYLGHNRARVLAMALSSVAIVIQAGTLVSGGPALTLHTTLSGLSLDVLLLLALSSDRARHYARRYARSGVTERRIPRVR
jgi:hypothetical protein